MKKIWREYSTLISWIFIQIGRAGSWSVLVLLLFICFQGLVPLATLYILKSLTEALSQNQISSQIGWVLGGWIALIILQNMLNPLAQMTRIRINERIYSYFSVLLMRKANSLQGLNLFESKGFQDTVTVLREETKQKPLNLIYITTDGLKELIAIVSILLFLGSLSLWLPFVIACSVLPQVVLGFLSEKKVWDYALFRSEDARKMGRICSLSLDPSIVKELKVYGFGEFLADKFQHIAGGFYQKMAAIRKQQYLASLPYVGCAILGQVIAVGWIAFNITNNALSLSVIVVMVQALYLLQGEIMALIQDMSMLSPVISYFQTFRKFLLQKDSLESNSNASSVHGLCIIEFRNVTFGYEIDKPILRDLSCTIQAGEKVAIVGPNGAGKSTLIKLLCRFYDPQEGAIFINGVDLRQIDLLSWRKQISCVFQDYGKYPFSLGENVGVADTTQLGDKGKLKEALKKGGVGYLINQLPIGLDTVLGKEFSGKELSFGEWQKLAISRLFFRDAPVIVMDEPTASLDPHSEYEVFQKLTEVFERRTVLLITHRLNSVKMCDRILVLKNGKILEEGPHSELMQQKGEYHDLFSLQASGYEIPR